MSQQEVTDENASDGPAPASADARLVKQIRQGEAGTVHRFFDDLAFTYRIGAHKERPLRRCVSISGGNSNLP